MSVVRHLECVCGARSPTFRMNPGGDIRAKRWESAHRDCVEPFRHGPYCPKNPDPGVRIQHMVDFCTCPGGRGR